MASKWLLPARSVVRVGHVDKLLGRVLVGPPYYNVRRIENQRLAEKIVCMCESVEVPNSIGLEFRLYIFEIIY